MVQQSVSHVAHQVIHFAQQIEEHSIDSMHTQHVDSYSILLSIHQISRQKPSKELYSH